MEDQVRSTHGLVGAKSLSHGIAGVSRRAAADIKAQTLTAMERERRARRPGVPHYERLCYAPTTGNRGYGRRRDHRSGRVRFL